MSVKRSIFIALCMFILQAVLAFPAFAAEAAELVGEKTPLFYEVKSGKSVVYLMGSIHIGKKEMYPLPGEIMDAFEESDYLVLEADFSDQFLGDVFAIVKAGVYFDDDGLERHISTETMRELVKFLKANNLSFKQFRKYKPWFAAMMIEAYGTLKMGFDAQYGIDKFFKNRGRDEKEILELEGAQFQIDLLDSLTNEEQEEMLKTAIGRATSDEGIWDQILRVWLEGDAEKLEEMILEEFGDGTKMSSIGEKLLLNRNKGMVEKIEGYIETGGKYFVVVGAGHIVGKKGIVDLLEKKEYKVVRIKYDSE